MSLIRMTVKNIFRFGISFGFILTTTTYSAEFRPIRDEIFIANNSGGAFGEGCRDQLRATYTPESGFLFLDITSSKAADCTQRHYFTSHISEVYQVSEEATLALKCEEKPGRLICKADEINDPRENVGGNLIVQFISPRTILVRFSAEALLKVAQVKQEMVYIRSRSYLSSSSSGENQEARVADRGVDTKKKVEVSPSSTSEDDRILRSEVLSAQ